MGGEGKIPCLDFSGEAMDEESEAWKALSSKVREACETHGCFLVEYSKISVQLSEAMFMEMKRLFDLPEDTKKKHNSTLRFNGYFCSPFSSIHESFGINDAHQLQLAGAFTDLMWPPHGNPSFWIACIASCSEVEGETKFKACRTTIVSVPSMFVGVVSSCSIGSTVPVEGSSVTFAMDVLEYSHRRRQLWRSGLEILF